LVNNSLDHDNPVEEKSLLPNHVAIIMDGNGRWAEKRGLPRLVGHQAGLNRIHSVVKTMVRKQIEYLTLYGFSTENWNRPQEEVHGLFNLLEDNIDREAAALNTEGVKISHIGRLGELPQGVQGAIKRACHLTRDNTQMTLCFAFNYGGRIEIVDTARRLIELNIPIDEVNEKNFADHLYIAGMPDVDLVIRTGGELRISNFLLWQAAYAEYYFTKVLWPDFTSKQIERALFAFSQRQRRFGGL
jgi:undecaprenyl diphosphate synthase